MRAEKSETCSVSFIELINCTPKVSRKASTPLRAESIEVLSSAPRRDEFRNRETRQAHPTAFALIAAKQRDVGGIHSKTPPDVSAAIAVRDSDHDYVATLWRSRDIRAPIVPIRG